MTEYPDQARDRMRPPPAGGPARPPTPPARGAPPPSQTGRPRWHPSGAVRAAEAWQSPSHPTQPLRRTPSHPPPVQAPPAPVHAAPRRRPPGHGWRRILYRASLGLINLGPSPLEREQEAMEARVRSVLLGNYKIGVLGKGGVGKTTVTASVGSVFAELRANDRVVAVDADTAFGKLGSRIDPYATGSFWELAADKDIRSFDDVRRFVGNNAAGLFVLAGESATARRRVLDAAVYREAAQRLDRHFLISVIDCASTMDSPVTQEVLRDLDALIVVSSPWVDGATAAAQTMEWLSGRGLSDLLQRAVVVLNDSDGHADKRTRSVLAQQFVGRGVPVIEVPFDPHLRPGGVISGTTEMGLATRRRLVEIAAAIARHFPSARRPHGR